MGAVQGKRTVYSTCLCIGGHSSGPLKANQGISKPEPRDDHAVCTLWVHQPTSPYPTLFADEEPISKGSGITCQIHLATSGKGLTLGADVLEGYSSQFVYLCV